MGVHPLLEELPALLELPPADTLLLDGFTPLDEAARPLEGGTWPLEGGTSPLEGGTSPLEGGTSPLEGGTWPLEGGTWPLEGGTWPLEGGTSCELEVSPTDDEGATLEDERGRLLAWLTALEEASSWEDATTPVDDDPETGMKGPLDESPPDEDSPPLLELDPGPQEAASKRTANAGRRRDARWVMVVPRMAADDESIHV